MDYVHINHVHFVYLLTGLKKSINMEEECYGTPITQESEVLGNIAKHFNNPEKSDVTLMVGSQSYYVHRFMLSAQSSVFDTMLTNGQWKESEEREIKLEESPESEAVFCDFLKFFYTGRLTLSCKNVCGIHMLADKYDVASLKENAVSVMKDVLTGRQDGVFRSSLAWLLYIEQHIPDLLPACYDAIRTNFHGYTRYYSDECMKQLEAHHLREILAKNNIFVRNELRIFEFVGKWVKSKSKNLSKRKELLEVQHVLQQVRFYNMTAADLRNVEKSELGKAMGKSFVNNFILHAYKVHSEMLQIVGSACKKRKLATGAAIEGEYKCPCDGTEEVCPHLNPRLYFDVPYGLAGHAIVINPPISSGSMAVKPIDLRDLKVYARLHHGGESTVRSWTVSWVPNYRREATYDAETFMVKPATADIGRQYTLSIGVVGPQKSAKYRYAIMDTGTVQKNQGKAGAQLIELLSPRRPKGQWDISYVNEGEMQKFWLGAAVHLHKPEVIKVHVL